MQAMNRLWIGRNKLRSRLGAMMTVEFALGILGVVVVALVVGRVANWAIGLLAHTSAAHEEGRVAAGTTPSAGEAAQFAGGSLDLVGPDGPESLGGFANNVGRVSLLADANECAGFDTDLQAAKQQRDEANSIAFDDEVVGSVQPLIAWRNVAFTGMGEHREDRASAFGHYDLANELHDDVDELEELIEGTPDGGLKDYEQQLNDAVDDCGDGSDGYGGGCPDPANPVDDCQRYCPDELTCTHHGQCGNSCDWWNCGDSDGDGDCELTYEPHEPPGCLPASCRCEGETTEEEPCYSSCLDDNNELNSILVAIEDIVNRINAMMDYWDPLDYAVGAGDLGCGFENTFGPYVKLDKADPGTLVSRAEDFMTALEDEEWLEANMGNNCVFMAQGGVDVSAASAGAIANRLVNHDGSHPNAAEGIERSALEDCWGGN
jgi:hypothetical protein